VTPCSVVVGYRRFGGLHCLLRNFTLPQHFTASQSRRPRLAPNPISKGYSDSFKRGKRSQSVNMTIHFHIVPTLRMRVISPPYLCRPLSCGAGIKGFCTFSNKTQSLKFRRNISFLPFLFHSLELTLTSQKPHVHVQASDFTSSEYNLHSHLYRPFAYIKRRTRSPAISRPEERAIFTLVQEI
jgi:hypothetical protein